MPKALIIDDDPLNLRLLSAMLIHSGFDVSTSRQGTLGVEMAQEIQPDIILLDLLMPKITYDGVKSAGILRSIPDFQHTPIIAVSAADTQTIKSHLIDGLFTDFLQKPITLEKLTALLIRLDQRDIA